MNIHAWIISIEVKYFIDELTPFPPLFEERGIFQIYCVLDMLFRG
jgi:hypothetical protein